MKTKNDYINNNDFPVKDCFLEKERNVNIDEIAEIEKNNIIKKYFEKSNTKENKKSCYLMVAKFLLNHAKEAPSL